jgi:PAS domain S-box-containing protein
MSRSAFQEHYDELTREINALTGELADADARKRLASVQRRIDILYRTLRDDRLLLETVLENSAASIYAKRRDGRYTYLNREMELLCNVTREQVLGRTDFEVFPSEIAQQWRDNDLSAMTTGRLTVSEETIDAPGGQRLVLSKKVPLVTATGEVEGICGISTDITDLRRTELALQEAVEKLERQQDNKMMNIEAVTATIAHEVRQPLGAIAANSSAALRFLERMPPDYDEVGAALNRIIKDCDRASEVFNSIRVLFQRVTEKLQLVDLNEVMLEVLRSFGGELISHAVASHTELASGLPLVAGHRGQLQALISNLVQNAIEAMEATTNRDRGLRVKTELQNRDAIVVSIEDSGPGFDQDQLHGMFDAFVTTKPHGIGLGLAICNMIVERHGGQLTAVSDGKNGAQFQFSLPVTSVEQGGAQVRDRQGP